MLIDIARLPRPERTPGGLRQLAITVQHRDERPSIVVVVDSMEAAIRRADPFQR